MNDHELTALVEAAASGACNSRVAIHGGALWEALDPATKNNYREAALPFVYHGMKALADLGYAKLAGQQLAAWDEGYLACLLQAQVGKPARNPYLEETETEVS